VTDSSAWRRILPPPRRRPGPLMIMVWWRVELVVAGAVGTLAYHADALAAEIVGGSLLVLATTLPAGRATAVRTWQLLAVPHRLRSAFVEAGVASRAGRLPWIFWARPVGGAVVVAVGLRSGITVGDLRAAVPLIRSACGAAQVDVVAHPERAHRATVVVVRPRRGLF
jgi:hypothetical protein